MELAKIRNKAQAEADKASKDVGGTQIGAGSQPPALTLPDDLFDGPAPDVAFPGPAFIRPAMSAQRFDPLAVIIAGRDSDRAALLRQSPDEPEEEFKTDNNEVYSEFLCFRLGDEEYGVNIMDIKEIIKPRELTEVPRAPLCVDGILSLRGVIVPVINMGKRLSLSTEQKSQQERIVIVKQGEALTGLRVDVVTGVVRIFDSLRESTPAALEGIDREYVAGIGRTGNRMIILLDVQSVADLSLVSGG